MKKQIKTNKKLVLPRDTVAILASSELADVAGGCPRGASGSAYTNLCTSGCSYDC